MTIFGITLSASDQSLLGAGGVLFMALVGFWLTNELNRRTHLRPSVQKYKAAFSAESSDTRNGLFRFGSFIDAYPRYKTAVDDIMPILPKSHQRKLLKAWDEYCGKGTDMDAETFIAGCSNHHDLYHDFKKRFNELHSCLDDLL